MITRLFSSALLVATATGCVGQPIERHSILRLDACGDDPLDEPVDLGRRAQEAGCATSSIGGWGVLELTVEVVVSPREFLVNSRYGRERIRPAYNAGAAAVLRSLDAQQLEELGARLESALAGQVLLEPNSAYAPVVADDGLRVVALYDEGLHSLDEVVQATTRAMPRGRERLPVTIEDGIDLSRVSEAADARQQRVAATVKLAEHFSAFRAPPSLTVEWVTSAQVPRILRARDDPWGEVLVTCFGEEIDAQDDVVRDPDWSGVSLPDGEIYMKSDREWRELELRYCLLHELMHQHEYSLCAEGRVAFGDLPGVLRQAYASSMAQEILRRAGAGNEALELVRDWDGCSSEAQAFDDFRLQSGLTPDEALLYLASHPDEAKLLSKRAYVRRGYPAGPLVFEYAGRSTAGNALVTVVNASPSSCSVYSTGWWHMTARGARETRSVGSTPFGLRLPPGGRVTLVTGMRIKPEDTVESVELDYSLTPAPVFGE